MSWPKRWAVAGVSLVLGLSSVSVARAAVSGGIRGRASLAGVLVGGLEVRVFPYQSGSFGPLTNTPLFATAATAVDGTYEVSLPPGRYVVEGLKKAEANTGKRPETGDLYCLYSGSPVVVTGGGWTAVGLNLVRVPAEQRKKEEPGGLRGRITWKGAGVEKVYLYAYDEVSTAFHGPAKLLQPVAKGVFQFRAPPGTYYLVARKRARGGPYGPLEIGDLFNFYPRNPVVLAPGEGVSLEIPLVERLSQLEEDPGAYHGLGVKVVDATGKAEAGYYVLAYATEQRSGTPLATSLRTDGEGKALVPLPPGQAAFLRARRSLGGPLESTEVYADGQAAAGVQGEVVLKLRRMP